MSDCQDCDRAATNPLTPRYHAHCKRCSARLIAHGQEFWRSATEETLQPAYRKLLEDTFGFDWKTWHAEVKAWAERVHQRRQWEAMREQQLRQAAGRAAE